MKSIRPFISKLKPPSDVIFKKWAQLKSPLYVEIGCGAGLHPIQWTKANPNSQLVAIERTKEKFQAFAQRISNNPRPNLYGVNQDAYDWIPANLLPKSVDGYFILYPNPYPKAKQANKRMYRSSFFEFLLETLKADGEIHIATNESFLYEEAREYLSLYWKLDIIQAGTIDPKNHHPRTHFEKKYLIRGETCYDIVAKKKK